MKTDVDYIIVGQGIAGSLLAYRLLQKGCRLLLIDNAYPRAASKVAAGLINPITGRRMTTTWLAATLLPTAKALYTELEALLQIHIYHALPLYSSLGSVKEENDWLAHEHSPYISPSLFTDFDKELFAASRSFGSICEAAQIDFPTLLTALKKYFLTKTLYWETDFSFDALQCYDTHIQYHTVSSQHIIFCRGAADAQHPFFKNAPFLLAKGEALHILPQAPLPTAIWKSKVTVVPIGSQRFWIGSTYAWHTPDDLPTEAAAEFLHTQLRKFLPTLPYETVSQVAGIRPTTQTRRPLLGTSVHQERVHLFNGLGTKGASLAPYFSQVMRDYLCYQKPLPSAVNVSLAT